MAKAAARTGIIPMALFGMEPEDCQSFLKGYGWRIIEDVGYHEMADKYIVPTGRRLASTPVERVVCAERV